MRDNEFLQIRLDQIWEMLFPDTPKANDVKIFFKGRWKNKFGHIAKRRNHTEIAVNGLFKSLEVPEYIIDVTVAHELVHYMHGFNSPLPQKFLYPHKGGIVEKELLKRGFGHSISMERDFVKQVWPKLHRQLKEF